MYRDMRRESGEMMGESITLKVHPEIAELLLGEEQGMVESLERWLKKEIIIRPDGQLHLEQYDMYERHQK
jgi:ribonuclease G